jgi:tellurite resistance protein TerC
MSGYPLEVWVGFNLFVLAMIAIDLFVIHKDAKEVTIKQALLTSALWIALALTFNVGLYFALGKSAALAFFTGYLIEKSLSIDNLFVFLLLFKYFQTPKKYQYKVLFWGILGAIIMRALFIYFGLALIAAFGWVFYLFGAFLIYTGYKMAFTHTQEIDPKDNPILRLANKLIPINHAYEEDRFFVKKNNKWHATPLFAVLIAVESTDLIFALDSIPAVMAITLDPFLIYTSNIFAILGLRSLYFALSHMMGLFHHLHYGLAAILAFVGLKMLLAHYVEIPITLSLAFIALSLLASIIASRFTKIID